jgi:hypothetical protein
VVNLLLSPAGRDQNKCGRVERRVEGRRCWLAVGVVNNEPGVDA